MLLCDGLLLCVFLAPINSFSSFIIKSLPQRCFEVNFANLRLCAVLCLSYTYFRLWCFMRTFTFVTKIVEFHRLVENEFCTYFLLCLFFIRLTPFVDEQKCSYCYSFFHVRIFFPCRKFFFPCRKVIFLIPLRNDIGKTNISGVLYQIFLSLS